MVTNALAPEIFYVTEQADSTETYLLTSEPDADVNKLYIPKINLNVSIVDPGTNEEVALSRGVAQRSAEQGDPKSGGDFFIVGHRLHLGLTPWITNAQSPFYHLNRVNKDDDIYVDWEGTRYAYKVHETRQVEKSDATFEEKSDNDSLYLYSTEAGENKHHNLVVAKPVGTIIWVEDQPRLRPFSD